MKIEVKYFLDGAEITRVIERDCVTKEDAGQAAIEYAREQGSRHFPFFRIIDLQDEANPTVGGKSCLN